MLKDWSASICLGSSGEEVGALVVGEVGEDVGDSMGVLGVAGLVAFAGVAVEERRKRKKNNGGGSGFMVERERERSESLKVK
ncbi:hypothetical protein GQ457_07G029750 [Hibiscus cannabinus]